MKTPPTVNIHPIFVGIPEHMPVKCLQVFGLLSKSATCLGMIGRTMKQLSTQRFVEFFPEFEYKLRPAVRHYSFWNPVQTENTGNIHLGIGEDWIGCLVW
jgi:hypothetical protein